MPLIPWWVALPVHPGQKGFPAALILARVGVGYGGDLAGVCVGEPADMNKQWIKCGLSPFCSPFNADMEAVHD